MNKKFKGFTLTEVLVTLAIIGVVSALTVPTLMNTYQKKAYVTTLQKTTAEISSAASLLMTDEGKLKVTGTSLYHGGTTQKDTAGKFLRDFFKVVTDCGSAATPCFASSYSSISGSGTAAVVCTDGYAVTLANGAAVCMKVPVNTVNPVTVFVDTNGTKGPNIAGRDFFMFYLYYDGSVDEGVTPDCRKDPSCSISTARATLTSSCLTAKYPPTGCFARILNDNWEMNY